MTLSRRRELLKRFHPDLNGGKSDPNLLRTISARRVTFNRCVCGVTICRTSKRCRICARKRPVALLQ